MKVFSRQYTREFFTSGYIHRMANSMSLLLLVLLLCCSWTVNVDILSAQTYTPISMASVGNGGIGHLVSPPFGPQVFKSIPFSIQSGSRATVELSTAKNLSSVTLPVSASTAATAVYLLSNGSYVFPALRNVATGRVTLTFANNATSTFDLIPGVNVRETWDYTTTPFNGTISSLTPSTTWQNAYTEQQSRAGRAAQGFLDLITIPVPANLLGQRLTSIRIERLAANIPAASQQFGLLISAVTVGLQSPAVPPVNTNDSLALVALYNNAGGATWTNRSGWLTTAPVSSWFGITTTNNRVTQITLNANNLRGILPIQIGNLTALMRLDVASNQLSTTIPLGISSLTALTYLDLSGNQFSGTVPSLSGLSNLQTLWLSRNQLSGGFPASLTALRNLRQLSLANNNFIGQIPLGISGLTALRELYINNNIFSGGLPSLNQLANLAQLDISFNAFIGLDTLPSSLRVLVINSNRLFDFTPPSISAQINAFPQALRSFTIAGQGPFVTSATVTQTPVVISANDLAISYQWLRNGVAISGATSRSYNITQSGLYSCNLTNNVGRAFSTSSANITVNAPVPAVPTISSFTPSSGGTGATVTITGTNFTGTTAVRFGGIPAQFYSVDSPTQITANIGTGASGPISVSTPAGTANSAQSFSFLGANQPSGVSLYAFSQSAAQALTVFDATATTLASGIATDDQTFTAQVGFPFAFNGASYSSLTVSANGWVSFGGAPSSNLTIFQPLASNGGTGVIALLATDIQATPGGRLWTKTVGVSPNRQFIVQWSNFGIYNGGGTIAPAGSFSMELILNENGKIDLRYGLFSLPATVTQRTAQIGLRGTTTSDFHTRTGISWAALLRGGSATSAANFGATATPANLTLSFSPIQQAQPLNAPQITLPINNSTAVLDSTGNITLQWTPVAGATSYNFVVSGNSTFSSNPIYGTSTQAPTTNYRLHSGWFPGITSVGVPFFFRVYAIVNGQATPTSPVVSAVVALPVTITSVTPATGLAGQSVTLSITGQNSNFVGATAVILVPSAGGASVSGTITSRTATTLQATLALPSVAGSYNVVVQNAPRTATLVGGFSVTGGGQVDPPVVSRFNPLVNGWNYCNSENWIPEDYADINYNVAPYISYSPAFRAAATSPSVWPAWRDYEASARRFEPTTDAQGYPLQSVVNGWLSWIGPWGGSCYGFAISGIYNYVGPYTARSAYSVPFSIDSRRLQNRHQVGQYYANIGRWGDTPNQTVQLLRSMLLSTTAYPSILMRNNLGNGGHCVVPYRISSGSNAAGEVLDSVFVYDMNFAGYCNFTEFLRRYILVNRTRNTWNYNLNGINAGLPNSLWSGSRGFSVQTSSAAERPVIFSGRPIVATTQSDEQGIYTPSTMILFRPTFDNQPSSIIQITDRQGGTIINDKDPFGDDIQIRGAEPLLPITGAPNSPLPGISGYKLPISPDGYVNVKFTPSVSNADSLPTKTNFLALNSGVRLSTRLEWTTLSTEQPQQITMDALNDIVSNKAPNGGNPTFVLTIAKTDETLQQWENLIRIDNTALAGADSLDVRLVNDGDQFTVTNYNSAKKYDLTLYRAGTERRFEGLSIGQNGAHIFQVNAWDNLVQSGVTLFVDNNNDGKIDSIATLQQDMITSVKTDPSAVRAISLSVYPNPAQREMTVEYTLATATRTRIEVLNLLGQVVATLFDGTQNSGKQVMPFNIENIANGAYIVRVSIGGEQYIRALRIVR